MAEISGFVRRFNGHGASSAIFFAVESSSGRNAYGN